MAAADPSKSPERQKTPAEESDTSGERTEAAESGRGGSQKEESVPDKHAGGVDDEPGDTVRGGGSTPCPPEAGAESGAGAGPHQVRPAPKDRTNAGKMAEDPCSNKRDFDWSEPEENDEEGRKPHRKEVCQSDPGVDTDSAEEAHQNTRGNASVTNNTADTHEEEITQCKDEDQVKKSSAEGLIGKVDGTEDGVENDDEAVQEDDADSLIKPKKYLLECKDCGKKFNRREPYNLHRHFHLHADELTPLTCKECGLTFQHRSSLIKHRNEHKKDEELISPKKEVHTDEGIFQCAECRRIFSTVNKLRDHNCSSNTVEKPYHCPLCRQEFQFKVSVTKHMMNHSQESIFSCQECNQTFPNATALRIHQRCHSALKPYECPDCGMVFKHYSVMEDHRRRHTDNSRSHLCNICGKAFKYSSLLHQHQYLHTGQKPFRCPECGKNFAFAQNMKAHCRQHRLRTTNSFDEQLSKPAPVSAQDTIRGPGKENTHKNEEPKRTFNCPLCPQSCSTPANLRAHMLSHEAESDAAQKSPRLPKEMTKNWDKGHTCPHCPCVYRDESSWKMHLLSVHKSLAYLESLASPSRYLVPPSSDNIQAKINNEGISMKSYKCSVCEKSFRHRSVLDLHMRVHSKDKPYQCKVCGKGFRFSSYLQQHVIIHTGKKPYKCPDCGKDFAFLQNMRTHQKLHQEKPFRCTSCRKGYSDEVQLQHHMLSHNGDKPHKCDQCDKSFGLAYLLRDHMNTHTGERPHRCDECNKTFSWFSSLLVHQKIHARKRQSYSQYSSFQASARVRGRSGRGRRGGRNTWGWSRPSGGSGMVSPQQPLYPQNNAELHRRAAEHASSMPLSRMDSQAAQQKETWVPEQHPQPVQWKVDGGEVMPVLLSQHQHAASQQTPFDSPAQPGLHLKDNSQSGNNLVQSSDPAHMKESASSASSHPASVSKKPSSSAGVELRQHKLVTWTTTPTSTVFASTSSGQLELSGPTSYADGAALWSVRPALLANVPSSSMKPGLELQLPRWSIPQASSQKESSTPPKKEDRAWDPSNPQTKNSTVSQPEKPWNGSEPQKQWASGLASASTSTQIDQSSALPIPTSVTHVVGRTLWDIQTPPGIPKTINSTEKIVKSQEIQLQQNPVTSAWANIQTQKVPISIQYDPHHFAQGIGTPIWGFQSSPQTLLTGQIKPGSGPELQQQQLAKGTQIIINQPSPFFSSPLAPLPPLALPGPHTLHSVAVGALSRPPHPNIFFAPQPVISDRPHMPQTLSLPQLSQRTEPPKLGTRLHFPPERLLQCMICGCSLPRELDLQMHYLQHAQGEI